MRAPSSCKYPSCCNQLHGNALVKHLLGKWPNRVWSEARSTSSSNGAKLEVHDARLPQVDLGRLQILEELQVQDTCMILEPTAQKSATPKPRLSSSRTRAVVPGVGHQLLVRGTVPRYDISSAELGGRNSAKPLELTPEKASSAWNWQLPKQTLRGTRSSRSPFARKTAFAS